jgi:hypothetical protein
VRRARPVPRAGARLARLSEPSAMALVRWWELLVERLAARRWRRVRRLGRTPLERPAPAWTSVRQIEWGEGPHGAQLCPMRRGYRRPCSETLWAGC